MSQELEENKVIAELNRHLVSSGGAGGRKVNFPNVQRRCPGPGQTCYDGQIDQAMHGSPDWQTCPVCKGTGQVVQAMTVDEKLEYLLCQLENTLAEKTAEVERVSLQKDIIKRWHTRNEEDLRQQLATLTERLAAAENKCEQLKSAGESVWRQMQQFFVMSSLPFEIRDGMMRAERDWKIAANWLPAEEGVTP